METENGRIADGDESPQSLTEDRAAAIGLGIQRELDAIGYPPAPMRAKKLAKDLGVTRAQVFKILRGESFRKETSIFRLAAIGVSIDRALRASPATLMHLRINGKVTATLVETCPPNRPTQLIAVKSAEGVFELQTLETGQEMPPLAIRIKSISAPERFTLAIIDDDLNTLVGLTDSMKESFHTTPYSTKGQLLTALDQETAFNAFLVDWRIPDVVGDELIRAIRSKSTAPIFILTGERDADEHIANALDYPNVHHATKPTSPLILSKRITSAISRTTSGAT